MISPDVLKKLSLSHIEETDLDLESTRSGWYTLRYDSKLFHQICIRPDNRAAYDYLASLGIKSGEELLNNGKLFLLPTNAYVAADQAWGILPADYIPRLIPDEKPFAGVNTSSLALYSAKHNIPQKHRLSIAK
jgi:hypothetical protein